jgi:hypothetical protein
MTLFSAPVASGALGYGYNGHHLAQDYEVPVGTPVYAAGAGTVEWVGNDGPLGNTLKISHPGGYQTFYGNLTTFLGTVGQTVTAGQEIGTSGGARSSPNPGDSTGPHLPYQVWLNGKAINPVTVTAPPNGGKGTTTASLASFNPLDPLGLLSGTAASGYQLGAIFGNLSNPGFWLRGAYIGAGATLLLIVAVAMFAHSDTGKSLIDSATTTAKTAGEAALLAPK